MATQKKNTSKESSSATAPATLVQESTSINRKYHPFLFILAFAFLLYGNTLWHDYALDDSIVITSNKYTKEGFSGLGKIFSTDAFEGFFGKKKDLVEGGRYRPLSIATFAIEWAISPNNPHFSHFINVLFYAACGLLLFAFLRMLFPEKDKDKWWMGVPFLLTALFMVHPIHTEVVANIKGRDELMALLFLLGGMIAAFKYLEKTQLSWLLISGFSFFLGMLSKETPLPFVVILPLTIWFFRKESVSRTLLASMPFLAASAVYLVIRFSVLGFHNGGGDADEILNDPFMNATGGQRIATVIETWGIYLVKLFVPIQLSHDYYFNQIPLTTFSNPVVMAALAVNLGLLGTGIWLSLRKNAIGYGILWYFISFSITSNLVVSIGTTMGERFVFVPSLGFLIAVVIGVQSLGKRMNLSESTLQYAMIALVAVPFAIRTVVRNQVWKDNYTLFTSDADVSPNSAKVQTAAGGVMIEKADEKGTNATQKVKLLSDALVHLKQAVKIYPEHGNAWLLMGNAYHNLEDYQNSLAAYQNAMNFRPLLWDSYKNAEITARKIKKYDAAAAFFKIELDRKTANGVPVDAEYWFNRGNNYEEWGVKPDSAIWAYQIAVEKDPKMAKAFGQMARVFGMQMKDYDHAIEFGEKAIAADPQLDWVYENVGIAHAMKGDFPGSISAFQRGIAVRPSSGKLYLNLALTYQNMGDMNNAQAAFAKAFELDPSLKR